MKASFYKLIRFPSALCLALWAVAPGISAQTPTNCVVYGLPTEAEWYKGAYYQPAYAGHPTSPVVATGSQAIYVVVCEAYPQAANEGTSPTAPDRLLGTSPSGERGKILQNTLVNTPGSPSVETNLAYFDFEYWGASAATSWSPLRQSGDASSQKFDGRELGDAARPIRAPPLTLSDAPYSYYRLDEAGSRYVGGTALPTENEWYKAAYYEAVSRYAVVMDGIPAPTKARGGSIETAPHAREGSPSDVPEVVSGQDASPFLQVVEYHNGTTKLIGHAFGGLHYTIQASTNLVDWVAVFTTNTPDYFCWSDEAATNAVMFYRAVVQP